MKKVFSAFILLLFTLIVAGQTSTCEKKFSPAPIYQIVEGANNSIYTLTYGSGPTAIALLHLNAQGDTIWSKTYTCPSC